MAARGQSGSELRCDTRVAKDAMYRLSFRRPVPAYDSREIWNKPRRGETKRRPVNYGRRHVRLKRFALHARSAQEAQP